MKRFRKNTHVLATAGLANPRPTLFNRSESDCVPFSGIPASETQSNLKEKSGLSNLLWAIAAKSSVKVGMQHASKCFDKALTCTTSQKFWQCV